MKKTRRLHFHSLPLLATLAILLGSDHVVIVDGCGIIDRPFDIELPALTLSFNLTFLEDLALDLNHDFLGFIRGIPFLQNITFIQELEGCRATKSPPSPSANPTRQPTPIPTATPTISFYPTISPQPTISFEPSDFPSLFPSDSPTISPEPTTSPTTACALDGRCTFIRMLDTTNYTVMGGAARMRSYTSDSELDASSFTPECSSSNTISTFYSFVPSSSSDITVTFSSLAVSNPVIFIAVSDETAEDGAGIFIFSSFSSIEMCLQGGGVLQGNTLLVDGSGTRTRFSRFFPPFFMGAAVAIVGDDVEEVSFDYLSFGGQAIIAVGVDA